MGTNTIIHGKDTVEVLQNDPSKPATTPISVTSNAMHAADQSHIPGGRNESSLTTDYTINRNEANATVVDIQTAITLGAGAANDTHLMGILVTVALTGTCVITGFNGSAGTAISVTLPAGTVAGYYNFNAARNEAGALTVTASNAADDNDIVLFWRPI